MKKIVFLSLLFFTTPVMAIIVNDFNNMCGTAEYDNMYATFEPIEYNCANGYYLPADSLGCVACPYGATCNGGTYAFNETKPQGVVVSALITQNQTGLCSEQYDSLIANFEPIEYTCSSGYYLPADAIECTICPENSICSGGTYAFNETIDQGIEPAHCANGYHTPVGSSSASDCVANVITINWSGADAEDILANNAGQCTYGGDIRTPVKARHIPGQTFVGWTFDVQ